MAVAKLNQIIAVEKGVKSKSFADLTDAHQAVQKSAPLAGISRVYQPKDEEGEQLPPESTRVQLKTEEILRQVAETLTRLFDVTATKDWSNLTARADVTVDELTIARDVPVTYLLFLEKQLTDLHTFVAKLPVLDPAENWTQDGAPAGCWRSAPATTMRSKKVPRNHVLYEHTPQHPAQVQMYNEDIPVGDWTTIKLSGAMPARQVRALTDRVTALQHAVKYAREEANATEITDRHAGEAIFEWLLSTGSDTR
jgi:hypothetical protein